MAMRKLSAKHWRAAPRRFLLSRSISGCYAVKSIHESNAPRDMSAIGTKWAIRPHQRLISPILIGTVCAAVFVLFICAAPARDLGQWEGLDPLHRQWFNGLMRPDRPTLSCCGLADA